MLVMFGGGVTVKGRPLLATPPTVTMTLPVVAPTGTGTSMLVAVQLEGVPTVPLNVTVLVPWVAPKFVPTMVTTAPTGPCVKPREVRLGPDEVTVNKMPLLATPLTVTTTLPVVAPLGTGAVMLPTLQPVGVAVMPLKATVLAPWLAPKFAPAIVTDIPTVPEFGVKLVMLGGTTTVKFTALLARPPTVTTTLPVVAPVGTGTAMLVAVQLVGVAVVPLNVTVLDPCEVPKFAPAMVIDVPTVPEFGVKLVMLGGMRTVKLTPLLAAPPTVTTTLPVVAPVGTGTAMLVTLQLVGVAVMPLNFTVLVP